MRPHFLLKLLRCPCSLCGLALVFFFHDTATTEIYTLSLHDVLPICLGLILDPPGDDADRAELAERPRGREHRSEEHTSELQSRVELVCRLLLEKKNCSRKVPRCCAHRDATRSWPARPNWYCGSVPA